MRQSNEVDAIQSRAEDSVKLPSDPAGVVVYISSEVPVINSNRKCQLHPAILRNLSTYLLLSENQVSLSRVMLVQNSFFLYAM